jgi:hypothetical protein
MNGGDQVQTTPDQLAQQQIALQKVQDYETRWRPVEKVFDSRVSNIKTNEGQQLGKTNAATQMAFGQGEQDTETALDNSGAKAGSGKFNSAVLNSGTQLASSKGRGLAATDQAVQNEYLGGLTDIVNIGRGQSAQVSNDAAADAQTSINQATSDAEIASEQNAGYGQLVGQVAGTAGGYFGSKGGGVAPKTPGSGLAPYSGGGGFSLNVPTGQPGGG